MPDFDPDNSWSLREAIMRTGGSMLAAVARARVAVGREPPWWVASLAPEPAAATGHGHDLQLYAIMVGAAEASFDVKLAQGKLICWARPGAPHGAYVKLPWVSLRIEDWACGTLVTCGFGAEGRFVPLDGGTRYYDARIEKPERRRRDEPNKGGRPSPFSYRDTVIAAAVDHLVDEGGEADANAVTTTAQFMAAMISQIDEEGGPSSSALKDWARKAIETCREAKASIT